MKPAAHDQPVGGQRRSEPFDIGGDHGALAYSAAIAFFR